nr:hypothetical protein [Tanacetum cinerariifolium]
MDLFAFIHAPDPTRVRVIEREREVDEPRLLDATVGRTIPLLSVAPDCADSELEASVERLFHEGGSGTQTRQWDFASGGPDADIQPGASHPPKKLREDHGTPSGTSVGGKSRSSLQRLLVGSVLNAEVGVMDVTTFPFVTASVSTMPEREDECHTDSVAEPNLRAIGAQQRFVISLDSSHHSGPTITEAEVDSLVRSSTPIMTTSTTVTSMVESTLVAKEKTVKLSLFSSDSSSAGGADPNTGVFSDLTGSDFLVSVTNGSRLDDGHVCRKMVDEFAPHKFFASIRGMKHDQLSTEINVGTARQMSLSAEVRMRAEYNVKERRRLNAEASNFETVEKSLWDEVTDLEALVVGKERDLTGFTSVKSQNDALVDRVHEQGLSSSRLQEQVMVYENCMERLEKFQDDRVKAINDKFDKLYTDFATNDKSIEKGMQDGLSAGIAYGKEGRALMDVAAYNPSTEVDYISTLQQLQNMNFPLLAELKSHKDAIEAVMNVLRLEEPLADKLGLNKLQPHLALDVFSIRVRKIKENIATQRLVLHDVFAPLSEPFSHAVLTGTEGTSDVVPATTDTITALSTTFASVSIIAPISVDDYEVMGTDDQADADGNVEPFPNVDDAELNIP